MTSPLKLTDSWSVITVESSLGEEVSLLKVVITGARGMLGSAICEVLGNDYDLTGYDIEDFDIADADATREAILTVSPEAIIHLAAFTDVDACEDRRKEAFRCNALGSLNAAKAAREAGAYLIYVSTDYVFDGEKREPYVETDQPNPLSFYGLTKLYGEQYIAHLTNQHLIVRTSWLFGPNGKNFVDTILAKASKESTVRVVNDQRGSPTYTLDLAEAIRAAMSTRLEGIVHVTNSGQATWFELAEYAVALAGIETKIVPVAADSYPAKAQRPGQSALSSLVIKHGDIEPLPPWQDGVRRYLLMKGLVKEE